jgi:hypothetical protein
MWEQTGRTPLFPNDAPPAIFFNCRIRSCRNCRWFLLGQRQRLLIRIASLSRPAEPLHICAGAMRQVIICQFAMFQHRVDMRQTDL